MVIFRCSRALFLFLWIEPGARRTEAAEEWSALEETAKQPEGAGEQGKLPRAAAEEVPNPPEAPAPAEGSTEVTSTRSSQNDVLMLIPGIAEKGFVSGAPEPQSPALGAGPAASYQFPKHFQFPSSSREVSNVVLPVGIWPPRRPCGGSLVALSVGKYSANMAHLCALQANHVMISCLSSRSWGRPTPSPLSLLPAQWDVRFGENSLIAYHLSLILVPGTPSCCVSVK